MKGFDEYYDEAVEPGKRERAYGWATAIGLQDVDGLKVSPFLLQLARRNIEGEISMSEARRLIDAYHSQKHSTKVSGIPAALAARQIKAEYGSPTAKAIADLHRHDDVVNDVVNKPDVGINRRNDGINDGINPSDDGINDGIKYTLTETEGKAVKAILRDSHITATILSGVLSVKKRQAERILASLKKKAGLKRRGARKNGEWYFDAPATSAPREA